MSTMMWGYYSGWTWLWMGGAMLLVWGLLLALVIWAVNAFTATRSGDAALDTLRRRFAAGEISQDEFEKARKTLRS